MGISGHTHSYYAATANHDIPCVPLHGEARADVCVIGGGYTGLSTALHLREAGMTVILLEAERVGWGASGRNRGHCGVGQRRPQDELERTLGLGHARRLWEMGLEANDLVRTLISRHQIECDLRPGILHAAWKAADHDAHREEIEHLQRVYGYEDCHLVSAVDTQRLTGSEVFCGGLRDTRAMHLHPLNYALGLARAAQTAGVQIHEGSRVNRIEDGDPVTVLTSQGRVRASHLVVACNGYLGKLLPAVAGRIMPINNFLLATEPLDEATRLAINPEDLAIQDSRFVINYWKLSADGRLLFGGGENYSSRFPADIGQFVRRHMLEIYPQLKNTRIDFGWGGTLAITLKRMPAFGRLAPNQYYAMGYSGHGIPTATFAGKLLADAIRGSAGGFDVMASIPSPRFPGGTWLRYPGLVAGMLWYALKDRL